MSIILGAPLIPFTNKLVAISAMSLLNDNVYVGSSDGVATFSTARCQYYTPQHCMQCHNDPHCLWDVQQNVCTPNNALTSLATTDDEKLRICKQGTCLLRI